MSSAVDEDVEGKLLDAFPNLRSLEAIGAESDWTRLEIPDLPEEVQTGKLENGLTYYVRRNVEPRARAELYLVVGFGSLVEEEHERGIAHIIEHLGFSATKAYENHAIVKFLESIGAPFGACQNAYTSFDRTVYTLHVPTDKEGLLEEALTVLREFAYYTRIADEDLEKERKVVMEEWRESRNAQGRLFERYICALAKGCKYCERLPIGKEEVICQVASDTLRGFYSRFYHPSRMAVVAVGDFQADAVVRQISDLFAVAADAISPLPRSLVPPERPAYAVPDSEGVQVASSTDSELSVAQAMIDCKRPRLPLRSMADIKRNMTETLFHKALSSRLLKLMVEPKGSRQFFVVGTETGSPIPALSPVSISLSPLPGRMKPALSAAVREIERVRQHGFHGAEILRAKRAVLAEFEGLYIQRDQTPSESFAEEYVELYLDQKPAPGIAHEGRMVKTIIPLITMEDITAVCKEFDFHRNVVIKVATPPLSPWNPLYTCWTLFQAVCTFSRPSPKLDLPDSNEVSRLLAEVGRETLDAWPADADDVDNRLASIFSAMSTGRVEGKVVSHRKVNSEGVPAPRKEGEVADNDFHLCDEVVLSNGLKVLFKRTDLFDDEILLRGQRWGGLSEYQRQGLGQGGAVSCEAQASTTVAMMLGICGLPMESMQECLEGHRVEANPPDFGPYTTGVDASCSPVDLETMLTVSHLLFRCPVEPQSKSRGRLSLVKLALLASWYSERRDPESKYQKRVLQCISQGHPFHKSPSLWSILRLNFRKAADIFNERISLPREWTLVLVGKLPQDATLIPLLEQFLGSIPNEDRRLPNARSKSVKVGDASFDELKARENITPVNVLFPPQAKKENVYLKMVEPQGNTTICFPMNMGVTTSPSDPSTSPVEVAKLHQVHLAVRLLEMKLVQVLRFKLGKVYSVNVSEDFSLSPPQIGVPRKGTLSVTFSSDPKDADDLIEATFTELQRLRTEPGAFEESDINSVKQQDLREMEELVRKNSFWADILMEFRFSRHAVVLGDLGAAVSMWWKAQRDSVATFNAEIACAILKEVTPEDASHAVITMRPRMTWLWNMPLFRNFLQPATVARVAPIGGASQSEEGQAE
mmetsp:Transcript_32292/g.73833  ORF Transcript_32292/g.73833 Transcript_32292/m.73833 type:complete len:1101 (-) Transcript_32292:28-3330(-)